MKALRFLLFFLLACSFSGCFEMNEEITVLKNGTGDLNVSMDMGQMLEMIQGFMSPEDLEKADLNKSKDTTIQMKDLVDTASNLTADKKAILRDGTINMKMSLKEKLFKVNMHFPFKTMESLKMLYDNMGQGSSGMGSLLKGLNNNAPAATGKEPEFNQISAYFDLAARKNFISRTLNKEKYAKLLTDSAMLQMKQMGEMGGSGMEVKMNTIIKLPAAAKKVTGSKAELSADKKTITLKNSMMDIFEHPEVFEFSVEY